MTDLRGGGVFQTARVLSTSTEEIRVIRTRDVTGDALYRMSHEGVTPKNALKSLD